MKVQVGLGEPAKNEGHLGGRVGVKDQGRGCCSGEQGELWPRRAP